MAALRATQFASGNFSDAAVHTVYTVPAGHKIILKSIIVMDFSGVLGVIQAREATLGTFKNLPVAAYGNAGATNYFPCWIVFEAGQGLAIARDAAHGYTYTFCGSLMVI